MMSRDEAFKILGVSNTATSAEIRKAYHKLALEWHPDKHATDEDDRKNAEEMMKKIVGAYQVITSPPEEKISTGSVAPSGSSQPVPAWLMNALFTTTPEEIKRGEDAAKKNAALENAYLSSGGPREGNIIDPVFNEEKSYFYIFPKLNDRLFLNNSVTLFDIVNNVGRQVQLFTCLNDAMNQEHVPNPVFTTLSDAQQYALSGKLSTPFQRVLIKVNYDRNNMMPVPSVSPYQTQLNERVTVPDVVWHLELKDIVPHKRLDEVECSINLDYHPSTQVNPASPLEQSSQLQGSSVILRNKF